MAAAPLASVVLEGMLDAAARRRSRSGSTSTSESESDVGSINGPVSTLLPHVKYYRRYGEPETHLSLLFVYRFHVLENSTTRDPGGSAIGGAAQSIDLVEDREYQHNNVGGYDVRPGPSEHLHDVLLQQCPSPRIIMIEDPGRSIVEVLTDQLGMSLEAYQEYLVPGLSHPDSETWNTRFLPRDHVTLRWLRPVCRKSLWPLSPSKRRSILDGTVTWSSFRGTWRTYHELGRLARIFRDEWILESFEDNPADPSEFGREVNSAWEESVTVFRHCDGTKVQNLVFFFDPLPYLAHRSNHEPDAISQSRWKKVLPFKISVPRGPSPLGIWEEIYKWQRRDRGRYAPGPMHVPSDDASSDDTDATREQVFNYFNKVVSTRSDVTSWIRRKCKGIEENPGMHVMIPLEALFEVVRIDTLTLVLNIRQRLDEISEGSMHERRMQKNLREWRFFIHQSRSYLPKIRRSIHNFVKFFAPNSVSEGRLKEVLGEMDDQLAETSMQCVKAEESLRAEMALLESKRGIAQAESVSRLTELAFLYLPLTFAAGLFSINVREFEVPPPVWAFVLAAIVLVLASYALRIVQRSTLISKHASNLKQRVMSNENVSGDSLPAHVFCLWILRPIWKKVLPPFCGIAVYLAIVAPIWAREAAGLAQKVTLTVLMFVLVGIPTLAITAKTGGYRWLRFPHKVRPMHHEWRPSRTD